MARPISKPVLAVHIIKRRHIIFAVALDSLKYARKKQLSRPITFAYQIQPGAAKPRAGLSYRELPPALTRVLFAF